MAKRKRMIYFGCGLLITGFVLVLGYYYLTTGVRILVTNESDATLRNMELIYQGGVERIEELGSNATYTTHVNPTSESHLELSWIDSKRQKHFCRIDVYMEPDYIGSVTIKIDQNYRISWSDKIKSSSFGKL